MNVEKFRVVFKTPDALDLATQEAGSEMARKECPDDNETKQNSVGKLWALFLRGFAEQWVKHGEYVTIEFDYNAGTATVIRN